MVLVCRVRAAVANGTLGFFVLAHVHAGEELVEQAEHTLEFGWLLLTQVVQFAVVSVKIKQEHVRLIARPAIIAPVRPFRVRWLKVTLPLARVVHQLHIVVDDGVLPASAVEAQHLRPWNIASYSSTRLQHSRRDFRRGLQQRD